MIPNTKEINQIIEMTSLDLSNGIDGNQKQLNHDVDLNITIEQLQTSLPIITLMAILLPLKHRLAYYQITFFLIKMQSKKHFSTQGQTS